MNKLDEVKERGREVIYDGCGAHAGTGLGIGLLFVVLLMFGVSGKCTGSKLEKDIYGEPVPLRTTYATNKHTGERYLVEARGDKVVRIISSAE